MGKKQKHQYPEEFLEKLRSVTAKRAKTVIDHILKYGAISTEDLKDIYGYDHPPRAVRDVREQGIPIETFNITGKNNRTIAAYRFGDPLLIEAGKTGGRKVLSKKLKNRLVELYGSRCAICSTKYEARYLQLDHCVPFEVGGETNLFMLLCGSCNRAKSWSCEHCSNVLREKDTEVCKQCYWANPTNYSHIATQIFRQLNLTWKDKEVDVYEKMKYLAEQTKIQLPDYVKHVLEKHLKEK
jgi:hypothetical protein